MEDERITAARKSQPIDELLRKARKSDRRGIWTQEQQEYAEVRAKQISESVKWE